MAEPLFRQALVRPYGQAASNGNNALVASPGTGKRIVVTAFEFQNETAVSTTAILRAAGTTEGYRHLCNDKGQGLGRAFDPDREWVLPNATALELNLSGPTRIATGLNISWSAHPDVDTGESGILYRR